MQRELKERIKLCKEYKKKIKLVSTILYKQYKSGELSYSEYFFKLSRFLKGKTEEKWYSYYDSCIKNLRKIKNLESKLEKPREETNNNLIFIVLMSLLLTGVFLFNWIDIGVERDISSSPGIFGSDITGFVVFDSGGNDTTIVNKTTNYTKINDGLENITFNITLPENYSLINDSQIDKDQIFINDTQITNETLMNESIIATTSSDNKTIAFETLATTNIPSKISVQGKLTNSSGHVQTGTYTFVFGLYDTYTSGNKLWTENQSIYVHRGIYNAHLGNTNALNITFSDPYYLGISVEYDSEMTPRINLSSSPYAIRANFSDYNLPIHGGTIEGDIKPNANNTISLGNSTFNFLKGWFKDLFIAGKIDSDETVYIDDSLNISGGVTIVLPE